MCAAEASSTVQGPRWDLASLPAGSFRLVVTAGPDAGKTFEFDGSEPSRVFVGQSSACGIRLSDPQVSRRHASFDVVGQRLRVTDLQSTNGTYLDAVPILDAYATGGSTLKLGETAISIEHRAPVSAAPALSEAVRFGRVVGASTEMRRLYRLCERLAASDVSVVIEGETGTGKEVLAESLHDESPRASGPFVVFDCTAVPPNLLESELFGHERGAFTGAVAMRKGVFEQAHGGTLFVDEIGDLDVSLQPKLLRVLERCEVRRVGGDRAIHTDVRILAATRRNLDHEVQVGRFRDDLFHRLVVARIELPPLRRRDGDIPLLIRHFTSTMQGDLHLFPPDLLQQWSDYPWPGNVRELRNAVARRLALGDLAGVETSSGKPSAPATSVAGDAIDEVLAQGLSLAMARQRVIEHFERRYIEAVLAKHGGSVARAAEASGIARRYFQVLKARQAR